jgi:hypothetical protein
MIDVPLEKFCRRLHNETLCVARERAGYEATELGLGAEVSDGVLYRRLVPHKTPHNGQRQWRVSNASVDDEDRGSGATLVVNMVAEEGSEDSGLATAATPLMRGGRGLTQARQ